MSKMDHKEIFKKLKIKTFAETENEIRIVCPSPEHQDNRPSCSYNKIKKVWFCHGCNAKGTLKRLLQDKGMDDNIHTYETPESLLKQLKELDEQSSENENYFYFRKEFKKIENKTDCPYYLSQRLKMDTIKKFNLYICRNDSHIYSNRIIVPIVNEKNLSFVARDYTETADKKYLFPNGMPKSKFLFGNFKSETVILTEGVFDVMKMWEHGFKSCIAILGANLSQYQSQKLIDSGVKRLILYPDGDSGGVKLMKDSLKQHIFFDLEVMLSKWGQDPSDMSREETISAYKNRINYRQLNQKTTKSSLIDDMQESLKKISNW
tara:strand:- start:401 stop:1360 length:960 start_codon:yes stop_codon:yes gene_type:complete